MIRIPYSDTWNESLRLRPALSNLELHNVIVGIAILRDYLVGYMHEIKASPNKTWSSTK
jgi:hypothetical protein